mgnify:FL=1|tara:strand:- start:399 stop:1277 length:879 start_codon:yes stop_codon:yes gene_type:complete
MDRATAPEQYFQTFPASWKDHADNLLNENQHYLTNEVTCRLLRQLLKTPLEAEIYKLFLDGMQPTKIVDSSRVSKIFQYLFDCGLWPFYGMGTVHCDSTLESLGPFANIEDFYGCLNVANNYKIILNEMNRIRRSIRTDTREFIYTGTWRTLDIWDSGKRNLPASEMFPQTIELMRTMPIFNDLYEYTESDGQLTGFFVRISAIKPDTIILPHFGITNSRIRIQIPLVIPDGNLSIYCHNQERKYEYGIPILLNDAFIHGVVNETEGERIILLADLPHPSASFDQLKKFRDG